MAQVNAHEVKQAQERCLQKISRVRDSLDALEMLVRNCERYRLPFFREPLRKCSFTLNGRLCNLRHSIADLTDAMMPK